MSLLLQTTLDANGFCCTSGNIDECGVCDGFGVSCDFRVELVVNNSLGADEITNTCVNNLAKQIIIMKEVNTFDVRK